MYQSFLDSKEVYQILNGDMQVGLILAAKTRHSFICKVGVFPLPVLWTRRIELLLKKDHIFLIYNLTC